MSTSEIKKVSRYETPDGVTHSTWAKAQSHLRRTAAQEELDAFVCENYASGELTKSQLIDWLTDHRVELAAVLGRMK